MGLAELTVEEGGYLLMSAAREGETVVHDFVRIDGDLVRAGTDPIEIRFDLYVNELGPGTRVPLLSAANLGTDLQTTDFRVSCAEEFMDRILAGTLEIVSENGTNTLVFVQTSGQIIPHVGTDVSDADSWTNGRNWSDGQAPSADFEYIIPAGCLLRHSIGSDPARFAGRTLSILPRGDFAINGTVAEIGDLRLFSDGILTTRNDGDANRLRGTATVYAKRGTPFNFEIETSKTRTLHLEAELKGVGDLRFRYYESSGANAGGAVKTFFLLTGDNRGFTGGIEVFQSAVCVDVGSEAALGGPASEFRADRLLFTSNGTLRCSRFFAMSDPSRGITMGAGSAAGSTDGGTIEVSDGQTLVVSNRIAGTTSLRKTGDGRLHRRRAAPRRRRRVSPRDTARVRAADVRENRGESRPFPRRHGRRCREGALRRRPRHLDRSAGTGGARFRPRRPRPDFL